MDAITGTNSKANWQARLAGNPPPTTDPNQPEYGFYRVWQSLLQTWWPIAYWYDIQDGTLRCKYNNNMIDETRALELWIRAVENPITAELYKAVEEVLKAGQRPRWPDLNEAVTRSHNLAPDDDSLEGLRDAIEDMVREANKVLKAQPKDQDEADQMADVANRLLRLHNRADAAREKEKAPHWQACKDTDEKWRPIITAAKIYSRVKDWMQPFLTAKAEAKRKREAEARRQAEEALAEAQRLAAEAARAKEAAERPPEPNELRNAQSADERLDDYAAEAQAEAAAEAAEAAAHAARVAVAQANEVAAERVTAGTRGKSLHLRTQKVVVITDWDKAIAHVKDFEDVREAVIKRVRILIKAGATVPGAEVQIEEKVA